MKNNYCQSPRLACLILVILFCAGASQFGMAQAAKVMSPKFFPNYSPEPICDDKYDCWAECTLCKNMRCIHGSCYCDDCPPVKKGLYLK
ncbi:hypothetical protein QQ045_001280 [Rhodiola kirilowii]